MRLGQLTAAIATLDRPESLAGCLDQLLAGTVLPAEVVIVDQSATNSARAVVEQCRDRDVSIVYVHQSRRGLAASRNAAIARARYPVIAFTDDDCVPDPGWVEAIERTFSNEPIPDAMAGRILAYGPEIPGTYVVSPREDAARRDYVGYAMPWYVGSGGNFAVRSTWLSRAGLYDERLGAGSPGRAAEDAELFYRLLKAGARIRYEPDAIMYHRRQSEAQRFASRWNYGHGIGALCAMVLVRRDGYGARMLCHWLVHQTRELAGAVARREWNQTHQRVLSLRGTAAGLLYGIRIGQDGRRPRDGCGLDEMVRR